MTVERQELLADLQWLHPDRFDPPDAETLAVTEAVANRVDGQGRLDGRATRALIRDLCSKPKPGGACYRRTVGVLQTLNATTRVAVALPPERLPQARPGLAPPTASPFERLPTAEALIGFLTDSGRLAGHPPPTANILLGTAMYLVSEMGMGEAVVVGLLARIRRQDMGADGTVTTPIHGTDLSEAGYRFRPPATVRRLLAHQFWRIGKGQEGHRLFHQLAVPEIPGQPSNAEETQAMIVGLRSQLNALFADLAAAFEGTATARDLPHRIRSWRRFAHTGRYLPHAKGQLPPALIDAVGAYPLPVETPMPLSAGGTTTPPGDRLILERQSGPPTAQPDPDPTQTRAAGLAVTAEDHIPETWPRICANYLQAFRAAAQKQAGQNGRIKRQQALVQAYEDLAEEADELAPRTSLLHLALDWLRHKLCADKVTIATLDTYIGRIFPPELLACEETFDLADWDGETIEALTDYVRTAKHWGPKTEEYFLTTWAQFLQHAQAQGLLQEVRIRIQGAETVVPPARTRILTPQEIDHTCRYWQESGQRGPQMMALALALGFYGGLRASEVVGLTLADLYTPDDKAWIYVWGGKTAAARRVIPLHLLAPPKVREAAHRWATQRWREFGKPRRPDRIGLFGPSEDPTTFTRQGLIDPLLAHLRPLLGDTVDFHLLRHSCASWLFLRRQVLRDPDFAHHLHHQNHWVFSGDALERLRTFVSEPGGIDDPGDDWLRITKFMGHRDLPTLLRTYVHTLGRIHSRILNPD